MVGRIAKRADDGCDVGGTLLDDEHTVVGGVGNVEGVVVHDLNPSARIQRRWNSPTYARHCVAIGHPC